VEHSQISKPPQNAVEAVLISLIRDLLRGTEWQPLAPPTTNKPRPIPIRADSAAVVEVEHVREVQRLRELTFAWENDLGCNSER
jgi:hypothetical protein